MATQQSPKFVFVVGGVMSSVGKGVTTSSIALILQSRGYKVTAMKADPYINVDAGTMNPTEHGEVFVTEDGDETDQDIGNYERFIDEDIYAVNYMTTGRVYQSVINRERNLEYKGKCVEVVPHIPMEIIHRIRTAQEKSNADVTVIEIGGTVGEYQNALFLEAARMMKNQNPDDVAFVLVSYLPVPSTIGEMKTKPTQHAVRLMNEVGIQPDFIIARAEGTIDKVRRDKLALFGNLSGDHVIAAPDADYIYEVPMLFEKQDLSEKLMKVLGMKKKRIDPKKTRLHQFKQLVGVIRRAESKAPVRIGVVGKYFNTGAYVLSDSYISVIQALKHAAWSQKRRIELVWLDPESYEKNKRNLRELSKFDGIVVPGGFGSRGFEGQLSAIQYVREKKIPYFGLCYGMQLASVEIARNVAGITDAHTVEVKKSAKDPIIIVNPYQEENIKKQAFGGTMRLGAYDCKLKEGSNAHKAYDKRTISERHRHRYEFNNEYIKVLEEAGVVFSGINPQQKLVEIIEYKDHPWFVATQFHPELKSRPLKAHPLFVGFIKAAIKKGGK